MTVVTAPAPERCHQIEGCFNLRDLGGYPTADGAHVRWRRLFRSDALDRVSHASADRLADLSIATVVDLRTPDEVEHGSPSWSSAAMIAAPIPDLLPPREPMAHLLEAAFVASRYHDMLRSGQEALCEVLAVLTDPTVYPVAIQCEDGRDRTGIVSALVLGLLGVPDTRIVMDYMLSREAMLRRTDWLVQEYPAAADDLARYGRAEAAVLPEAIAGFIGVLRAVHGSFAGWAKSVDMDGAIPYLRANLLTR